MAVLKHLYRTGIIHRRSKCSNMSLKPVVITFTESIDKPTIVIYQTWVDMMRNESPPVE